MGLVFAAAQIAFFAFAQASPEETALRARVEPFFEAVRAGKYRVALQYVSDDSQDAFLGEPKSKPLSVAIDNIEWLKPGEEARVTAIMEGEMMVAGQVLKSRTPQESYWRKESEGWMWFEPPVRERRTPFGVVKIDRSGNLVGSTPNVNLKEKVAQAPSTADILGAVEIAVRDVQISRSKPFETQFSVKNGLPGYVQVSAFVPGISGLTISPDKRQLASGETLTLTLKWTPGAQPESALQRGAVIVDPLGRRGEFAIRWVD
jgi:hypothetical protein